MLIQVWPIFFTPNKIIRSRGLRVLYTFFYMFIFFLGVMGLLTDVTWCAYCWAVFSFHDSFSCLFNIVMWQDNEKVDWESFMHLMQCINTLDTEVADWFEFVSIKWCLFLEKKITLKNSFIKYFERKFS